MPVVINDFEILVEEPSSSAQPAQQTEAPPPPPLRPEDIERIMKHFDQRRARLKAD